MWCLNVTLPQPGPTSLLPAAPMKLDLRSLSQSNGPPSELQARREKYVFFEKQCSEVADGLFLGSDVVARNREVLRAANITHVINCVGFLYPAYFQDELTYLVLYLQGELSLSDYSTKVVHQYEYSAITCRLQLLRMSMNVICACRHALGGHCGSVVRCV